MRPYSSIAAAVVLGAIPLASHAEVCLFDSETATDPYLCVPNDSMTRARQARLPLSSHYFPVRKIEVAPGSVAYVSDQEDFDGRVWELTGTLGEDALRARGITRKTTAVVAANPVACFYRGTPYIGKRQCFPPGPLRTYAPSTVAYASSIRIPHQLTVNTFTDFRARGAMATFRSSQDGKGLSRADMLQRIRSLHVARQKPPPILGPLVIPVGDAYDLNAIFGGHMHPGNGNPYVMMIFDADPGRDIAVTYGARVEIRMRKQGAEIRGLDPISVEAQLKTDKRSRYYLLAMELRPGTSASILVMQVGQDAEFIAATPWLDVPWELPVDSVLSIRNASPAMAIRLTSMQFEVGPSHDRRVRAVQCERLALKHCTLTAATSTTPAPPSLSPLLPPPTQAPLPRTPVPLAPPPPGTVSLTNIGMSGNPMAIVAAQRTCRVPLVWGRRPLGLPGNDYCISRAITIVTMYQAMFGNLWRLDAFTAIIDNILARGTTGFPTATKDAASEQQLIEAVRWQIGAHDTRRADALAAFHHANLVRAYSVARTMNFEGATTSGHSGNPTTGICAGVANSINTMRFAALGRYDLDLTQYTPQDVRPRILRNMQWVEASEQFEVMRVQASQSGRQHQVLDIMHLWQREYLRSMGHEAMRNAVADDCPEGTGYTVHNFLASTGLSAAMGIEAAIRDNDEDNEIFLVRYQGRPLAMLLGTIPRSRSLEAEITLMVSAPVNVLPPFGEGTIRGAGSAALQEFLKLCKERGLTAVRVDAVTEPSAVMHQRAGFRLLNDLARVTTEGM